MLWSNEKSWINYIFFEWVFSDCGLTVCQKLTKEKSGTARMSCQTGLGCLHSQTVRWFFVWTVSSSLLTELKRVRVEISSRILWRPKILSDRVWQADHSPSSSSRRSSAAAGLPDGLCGLSESSVVVGAGVLGPRGHLPPLLQPLTTPGLPLSGWPCRTLPGCPWLTRARWGGTCVSTFHHGLRVRPCGGRRSRWASRREGEMPSARGSTRFPHPGLDVSRLRTWLLKYI